MLTFRMVAAVGLAIAAGVVAPAAAAPAPSAGTLTPGAMVSWDGSTFSNAYVVAPQLCNVVAACDKFSLTVALGDRYWARRGGGAVQVGIQWRDLSVPESDSEYDGFDLYVYDVAGKMVASSADLPRSLPVATSAQVVDISNAPDGVYTVVVEPSNVGGPRSYHGVALVQPGPRGAPSAPRLPDLVAVQPTGFHVASGVDGAAKVENPALSCYPEETLQDPGHPTRCLRFDAEITNLGSGPFLLELDLTKLASMQQVGNAATTTPGDALKGAIVRGEAVQLVNRNDGSQDRRNAGSYYFHTAHAHVHYESFAAYGLFAVNPNGSRSTLVQPSFKSDFCLIEVDDLWFGQLGNGARTHRFPACNIGRPSGTRVVQEQGINPGWGDVYTWDLPGQYVDITHVQDGTYDLGIVPNPNGRILEANMTPGHGQAFTRIRLSGNDVRCVPRPYGCPPGIPTA